MPILSSLRWNHFTCLIVLLQSRNHITLCVANSPYATKCLVSPIWVLSFASFYDVLPVNSFNYCSYSYQIYGKCPFSNGSTVLFILKYALPVLFLHLLNFSEMFVFFSILTAVNWFFIEKPLYQLKLHSRVFVAMFSLNEPAFWIFDWIWILKGRSQIDQWSLETVLVCANQFFLLSCLYFFCIHLSKSKIHWNNKTDHSLYLSQHE